METTIRGYTSLAAPRAALREEARILLLALVHMLYRSSCSPAFSEISGQPILLRCKQDGRACMLHIEKLTRLLNSKMLEIQITTAQANAHLYCLLQTTNLARRQLALHNTNTERPAFYPV